MKPLEAVLMGVLVVGACGGGGGGGSSPTQPPAPTPGVTLRASGGSSNNEIALSQAAGTTQGLLRVDVRAIDVPNLFGVAFDVVYPTSALAFLQGVEGPHLGGEPTSFQILEASPGRVVIGLSRLGATGGVSGSGTLMTLEFRSLGVAASGQMAIENSNAFDPNAAAIPDVIWSGGTVTVVP
jgi:hypothetical protein